MYMQMMLQTAREQGAPVTRQTLRDHGRDVALFEGLRDRSWFDRMNEFGAQYGLEIEHYTISAGLEEMIQGCPIAEAFTHVFASKYAYDENEVAVWPAVGVNYTTKTQYLFRINKGVHNHWDDERINRFIPDEERPIPFDRMIFLGDGDTDVPTMKMMHTKGGFSIAVGGDGPWTNGLVPELGRRHPDRGNEADLLHIAPRQGAVEIIDDGGLEQGAGRVGHGVVRVASGEWRVARDEWLVSRSCRVKTRGHSSRHSPLVTRHSSSVPAPPWGPWPRPAGAG